MLGDLWGAARTAFEHHRIVARASPRLILRCSRLRPARAEGIGRGQPHITRGELDCRYEGLIVHVEGRSGVAASYELMGIAACISGIPVQVIVQRWYRRVAAPIAPHLYSAGAHSIADDPSVTRSAISLYDGCGYAAVLRPGSHPEV
jgi:hypothetical protein